MADNKSSSTGIGFTGLLTIVFITLKLTHYIDWSWWLVLMPLWIGLVLLVVGLIATFIYYWHKDIVYKNKRSNSKIDTRSKWQERYDEVMKNKK